MRALLAATIFMAVLIVAGVIALGVIIANRLTTGPTHAVSATLDEPAGTHLTGMAQAGNRLALSLQGGGPDRVVVVDPGTGKVVLRLSLPR
jgi:hypothetical protein